MSGMVVLALGVTLSTKTGLGVSTTTAIPYAMSGPTASPSPFWCLSYIW